MALGKRRLPATDDDVSERRKLRWKKGARKMTKETEEDSETEKNTGGKWMRERERERKNLEKVAFACHEAVH